MKISKRLNRMQPSATRAVAEKAADLRARGVDIISFSTGEPDFVSPEPAFDYARKAMEDGKTFYTATAGIKELKEEVAGYYRDRFGLAYASDQVMIGAGAKPLLFEVLGALIDPGDEVILTAPAWVSYVEQVRFFDGEPVVVDSLEGTLELDIEAITRAISDKTVAIILNSPHNPTGKIFSDSSLRALCDLARKNDLMIINDEVYERIVFDGAEYRHPLVLCPQVADHVININAVSKTYAMTGWRIGFALGPQPLIKKMTSLQGHLTSGACSIAQWAALGAIREAQDDVEQMAAHYQERKNVVFAALSGMPLIRHIEPQGAFYAFVDVQQTYGRSAGGGRINDDVSFCEQLLEHAHVAVVPGKAFLQPGYVRISFATDLETIRTGMARLGDFLRNL